MGPRGGTWSRLCLTFIPRPCVLEREMNGGGNTCVKGLLSLSVVAQGLSMNLGSTAQHCSQGRSENASTVPWALEVITLPVAEGQCRGPSLMFSLKTHQCLQLVTASRAPVGRLLLLCCTDVLGPMLYASSTQVEIQCQGKDP